MANNVVGREVLTRQVQQEISKWERLNTAHASSSTLVPGWFESAVCQVRAEHQKTFPSSPRHRKRNKCDWKRTEQTILMKHLNRNSCKISVRFSYKKEEFEEVGIIDFFLFVSDKSRRIEIR